MKFTTGNKIINCTSCIVLRERDENLELNYNVRNIRIANNKSFYINVPCKNVKIGETIYNTEFKAFGYRAD